MTPLFRPLLQRELNICVLIPVFGRCILWTFLNRPCIHPHLPPDVPNIVNFAL